MNEHVDKCHVKTETRFVNNSRLKQSNIQSLIAMSKGKALELYTKCVRPSVNTRTSSKVFFQDSCHCGPMVKNGLFV